MADITMCKGLECPVKEKCFRFTAKANEYRQSYFVGIPTVEIVDGIEKCLYFLPNDPENPDTCKYIY